MGTQQFEISLTRQDGTYTGQLTLRSDENGVSGCVTVLGRQNYFRGKLLRKNHYIISLRLQLGALTEDCDALLLAKEDGTLTGALLSPWQTWTLEGVRTAPAAVGG